MYRAAGQLKTNDLNSWHNNNNIIIINKNIKNITNINNTKHINVILQLPAPPQNMSWHGNHDEEVKETAKDEEDHEDTWDVNYFPPKKDWQENLLRSQNKA